MKIGDPITYYGRKGTIDSIPEHTKEAVFVSIALDDGEKLCCNVNQLTWRD